MYCNFKIDGQDILNFDELQSSFSLLDIYFQPENFVKFARVHCLNLSGLNSNGKVEKNNYFNNKYWVAVLCNEEEGLGILNSYFTQSESDFINIAKEKFSCTQIIINEMQEEAEKQNLKEKYNHILKSVEKVIKDFSRSDALKALAICELSQKNALEINDFSLPVRKEEEKNETGINYFPSEETLILTTSNKPHKFFYHSSDFLAEGEKIKTVMVKAVGANNKDAIIELYDDRDGKENGIPIKTLRLKNKEFLYCNTAGGRVIGFLSTDTGSGKDLRLVREKYEKSEIKVIQADGREWTLPGDNISCFSCAGQNTGFITIENGKLKYHFYKPAKKSDALEMRLGSITQTVVEVRVTDNGYFVLTEDGTVFDNKTETACRAVSLSRQDS